jgi:hypothetical protein
MATDTAVLVRDTWYYLACEWNGTHLNLYKNGNWVVSTAAATLKNAEAGGNSFLSGSSSVQFYGTADEIRVSNIARGHGQSDAVYYMNNYKNGITRLSNVLSEETNITGGGGGTSQYNCFMALTANATYPNTVNATCWGNATCTLLQNGTTAVNKNNTAVVYGVGDYNFTCYNSTNSTIKQTMMSRTSIGTPTLTMAGGANVTFGTSTIVVATANNVGPLTLTLLRNGTIAQNNTAILCHGGVTNYTLNTSGNTNYTSTSLTNYNINVTKAQPQLKIFGTVNGTYP